MYYTKRRYKNVFDCTCAHCDKPPKPLPPPCPQPRQPYCCFEIRCQPCSDNPPEIRFELKI